MVKELKRQKRHELSIPGVASTGADGYDFLRQSIADRLALAWWTGARQMAKLFGARTGLFASVMLISTTALAQQTFEEIAFPPTKQIEKHLHNYGNFDNTCIRWTDKCRTVL